jgi:lysophospholipase L1-like esterase
MASPPTIAAPVSGGTSSTITNSQFIDVFAGGTTLNKVFRYPYGTIKQASATFPASLCTANFAVSSPISGTFAAGTYNTGAMSIEVQTDAPVLELQALAKGGKYRILVDEGAGWQFTSSATGNANGTMPNDGSGCRIKVTFASRMPRNIRFELESGFFMGMTVGGNDSVLACSRTALKKALILGDSFTEPTGADNAFVGWGTYLCQLSGLEASTSGSGGTGYCAPGPAPRVALIGRVQTDVIDQNPDIVFIAAGINDSAFTPAQIQAAAVLLYQTIQTGLPNAKIVVIGNWFPRTPGSTELAIAAAIKAAALSRGIPFIDPLSGAVYAGNGTQLVAGTGPWVTGSGTTGSPQTTGNAHPAPYGHMQLGYRAAQAYTIVRNAG